MIREKLNANFPGWQDFEINLAGRLWRTFAAVLHGEDPPFEDTFPKEEYLAESEEDDLV